MSETVTIEIPISESSERIFIDPLFIFEDGKWHECTNEERRRYEKGLIG